MAARPIPRRTSDIELWDVNPVGTPAAWRREMLQFWALMLLRGRRARALPGMATWDDELGKNRARTVTELADALAARWRISVEKHLGPDAIAELRNWLLDVIIVPGERRMKSGEPFAAGLAVPHYGALAAINRPMTRERFWAAFYYSALASDLLVARHAGESELAGSLVETFATEGTENGVPETPPGRTWSLRLPSLARRDPETFLILQALAVDSDDGLGTIKDGLPTSLLDKALITTKGTYDSFLCPGTVILMRRALTLVLRSGGVAGRSALSDMIETILANHGVLYFIRGMRVLNQLTARRALPDDCASCWDRFQADLAPAPSDSTRRRWETGDYRGAATADNARWVDENCTAKDTMFVNAGPKELTSAKELGRLSLEELRRQLSVYTVNRIVLHICHEIAEDLAVALGAAAPRLNEVLSQLDAWAEDPTVRGMLALEWRRRLDVLVTDKDVPVAVAVEFPERLAAAVGDPRALEGIARWVVSEAILSARPFTRYLELMQSLLGGGALPSNQDAKGLIARGGSRGLVFHLSLRERTLETMTAIASLEAEEADTPLSFSALIAFLRNRYGILIDQAPAHVPEGATGLVAEATTQSREALRSRLTAMGLLEEHSDSSEWNRVSWRGVAP